MNRGLFVLLILFPVHIFSQITSAGGVLQVDVTVKVISKEDTELWSVDLTKYTVSERSIGLHLQGFDGDLFAEMTPVVLDSESLILQTSCVVKSLESGDVIVESDKELVAQFNNDIILYPVGAREESLEVVMIMNIHKYSGVYD